MDETWSHPGVQRQTSAIDGDGLFAIADLPAGTIVAKLGGRRVDDVELAHLFAEADAAGTYVDTIMLDDDVNLVLAPDQLVHYGNHSCDPSMWHIDPTTIATRRDVLAGEELTIDYATQTIHPEFELDCKCGSAICRGTVTGVDWTDPEWRRRYRGHVVPAVEQAIARWAA
jgi:uncharacterized protein